MQRCATDSPRGATRHRQSPRRRKPRHLLLLSAQAIAKKLATLESETRLGLTAVVTQGSEATVVASPPNVPAGQPEAVATSYPVAGNPWTLSKDQITDTNGAGDAFVGGFLSQLALPEGVSDAQKVHFGHFAAGAWLRRTTTYRQPCD